MTADLTAGPWAKILQPLTPAVLLAAVFAQQATRKITAVGDPIKQSGWEPLCTLTATLEKAADLAMGQIQQVTTGNKQYALAALKLQVLAEMETKQIGYSALATTAAGKADIALSLLSTLHSDDIAAVFYAGDLRGNIGGVLNLLARAQENSGTGYCLADSSGNHAGASFTADKCGNKYHTLTGSSLKLTTEITDTGFKGFSPTNAITSGAAGDGACSLTTTGTNAAGTLFKSATAANIMSGTVTIKADDDTGEWKINNGRPLAVHGTSTTDSLLGKTYNALHKVNSRDVSDQPADIDAAVTAAAKSAAFKRTLTQILKAEPHKLADPALSKHVNDIAEDLAVSKPSGLEQLLKDIKEKKPKGAQEDPNTETALSTVNNMADLTKVLSYYTRQHTAAVSKLQKEVSDNHVKCSANKPEEVCNAIGEQEKCDNTPGCHYNKTKEGKKCTLSEEGKKEA
ncbi:Trypanosome variant surface glycoprotein (A-type), putative [Trypanosoma equiperdum]|uniref:Trypanosome variant surface glycoprotein (A-type), putative n=1 Tax=Trypanosoma equiperdum TaxID=5694 RepID=A0A1G4HZZ7_TRYEQ|nr:Trypanosome variant surface glycoprotein (A-type), putative [Trypanosoma equiperdum]